MSIFKPSFQSSVIDRKTLADGKSIEKTWILGEKNLNSAINQVFQKENWLFDRNLVYRSISQLKFSIEKLAFFDRKTWILGNTVNPRCKPSFLVEKKRFSIEKLGLSPIYQVSRKKLYSRGKNSFSNDKLNLDSRIVWHFENPSLPQNIHFWLKLLYILGISFGPLFFIQLPFSLIFLSQ